MVREKSKLTILREVDSGKDHFISLPCLIGRGDEADS